MSSMKERFLSRGPDGVLSGPLRPGGACLVVGGRVEAVSAGALRRKGGSGRPEAARRGEP